MSNIDLDKLPDNPESFWEPGEPLAEPPPLAADAPSALARLGPSPFPRSGFPFLGFLDTVYEHVATHVPAHGSVNRLT
jgi:hypothetical protein